MPELYDNIPGPPHTLSDTAVKCALGCLNYSRPTLHVSQSMFGFAEWLAAGIYLNVVVNEQLATDEWFVSSNGKSVGCNPNPGAG